jgi:hypothetical protein
MTGHEIVPGDRVEVLGRLIPSGDAGGDLTGVDFRT